MWLAVHIRQVHTTTLTWSTKTSEEPQMLVLCQRRPLAAHVRVAGQFYASAPMPTLYKTFTLLNVGVRARHTWTWWNMGYVWVSNTARSSFLAQGAVIGTFRTGNSALGCSFSKWSQLSISAAQLAPTVGCHKAHLIVLDCWSWAAPYGAFPFFKQEHLELVTASICNKISSTWGVFAPQHK